MNTYITFGIISVILLVLELAYFQIADRFNIIDRPNERSSHSTIVLRGGGVIFPIAVLIWTAWMAWGDPMMLAEYWPFIVGMLLISGVSLVDDIRSLPDSVRLVAQFVAMGLAFYQLGMFSPEWFSYYGWALGLGFIVLALIVFVGATNIINFMDGINGITVAYALASLLPLWVVSGHSSMIMVMILACMVFAYFNFRPRGKAKCFAGDVGSVGLGFVLLFAIGQQIVRTQDLTWLIFLIIYGIDGVTTIAHRILLHENLGQAHRKHTFQLMANELHMSHISVSLIFAGLQLAINLGFMFLCPDTVSAHWCYLLVVLVLFGLLNLAFRNRYYHLHAEYLQSLKK